MTTSREIAATTDYSESPILVILSNSCAQPVKTSFVNTKALVSSMLRSLFGGRIVVFSNREMPLFKIGRSGVVELTPGTASRRKVDVAKWQGKQDFLDAAYQQLAPVGRQWFVVADQASLALRNLDHLFPSSLPGTFSPPEVDFYWARAGKDDISNHSASPGLWAVRGEHLPLVLERLKEAWSKVSGAERVDEEEIWTRVVHELPLRKRAFEKGEVVAPRIGAVDWEAVSNAAFVTVPDWPEKEAWKFLQALYFGTYLGDETGMMLNILEA